ncbi:hypothetical protein WJX84_003441 [Apatococcus fuscideae]|uniref:N-end aminoacyl transferase N-terminal domain-containing protein n=1 Tax=Apatococcus fuscideae TaxID=2026836 RepID=A0AAW1RX83_9CHLO
MSGVSTEYSYVHDIGAYRSDCGYCNSQTLSSSSFGMSAHSLTVDAYEGLLERGWRRSGCWLYRPLQHQSCCKTQTIRLAASEFRPTKAQQRVQRRMERFLAGQLNIGPSPAEPPLPVGDGPGQLAAEQLDAVIRSDAPAASVADREKSCIPSVPSRSDRRPAAQEAASQQSLNLVDSLLPLVLRCPCKHHQHGSSGTCLGSQSC